MNDEGPAPVTTFLLYQTEDGRIRIETRMQDESVWLTQEQMAVLFGKARSTINEHIKNIFAEGELVEGDVMRKFGNSEFSTKPTNYYNLDVIISVGYRVKSLRGTQFRIWATQRLREYLIKGLAPETVHRPRRRVQPDTGVTSGSLSQSSRCVLRTGTGSPWTLKTN